MRICRCKTAINFGIFCYSESMKALNVHQPMNISSLNIQIYIESVAGNFQPAYHVVTGENVIIRRNRKGTKEVKLSPEDTGKNRRI